LQVYVWVYKRRSSADHSPESPIDCPPHLASCARSIKLLGVDVQGQGLRSVPERFRHTLDVLEAVRFLDHGRRERLSERLERETLVRWRSGALMPAATIVRLNILLTFLWL
jgi:hypothetical protein